MTRPITKRYTNGEITVVWRPHLCTHSARCFHGLPEVFDPKRHPWIVLGATPSARVAGQVACCPSGALALEGARPGPGGEPHEEG